MYENANKQAVDKWVDAPTSPGQTQLAQKPRMDVALDDLDTAIKQLATMASHVANRAERVSRPAGPEQAGSNEKTLTGRSLGGGVVTQIDGLTEQARKIGAQLMDVLNRLEV